MRSRLFLLLLSLSLAACTQYAKLLSSEHSMLARVAQSPKLNSQEKLDSLFASGIRVMDAALKPVNPVKGGKMVAKYYDQNSVAMEQIAREVGLQFDKMNLIDRGAFVLNVGRSSNAKRFAALYPKFKKKYKEVKTAAKFLGFFSKSLGKLGKLVELLG